MSESVTIRDGALVASVDEGVHRRGGVVEAHAGDVLLGSALWVRAGRKRLAATIPLGRVPAFPADIRLVAEGREVGTGLRVADAEALLQLAGPPVLRARLTGVAPLTFAVAADRLPDLPRRFVLRVDGQDVGTATGAAGAAFDHAARPGETLTLIEQPHGVVALTVTLDRDLMLDAAMAGLARLQAEVAGLRAEQGALRRRLDTALDLGREQLLLERLDLFYLLLSERVEREVRARNPVPPAPVPPPPRTVTVGPAEIEGVGIFEVETDGVNEWRWFGPHATIALRDIAAAARRVVLNFHAFDDAAGPPGVRVSAGGAAEPALVRVLDRGFAVDVPLARARAWPDDMLILHVVFDRHHTSESDPRLLSAVFSGAEIVCDP